MSTSTERQVWQEPDYEGMIPKLEEAHIEINQLRFKIQKGGLELKNPIKGEDELKTYEITDRETGAILGMLIQEGNKRLKELSDVKSYLVAVKEEGMLKVKSGYVALGEFGRIKNGKNFKYLWSPSGIKADSFLMEGTKSPIGESVILKKDHEHIEDSMLLSIDFDELQELFKENKIPR